MRVVEWVLAVIAVCAISVLVWMLLYVPDDSGTCSPIIPEPDKYLRLQTDPMTDSVEWSVTVPSKNTVTTDQYGSPRQLLLSVHWGDNIINYVQIELADHRPFFTNYDEFVNYKVRFDYNQFVWVPFDNAMSFRGIARSYYFDWFVENLLHSERVLIEVKLADGLATFEFDSQIFKDKL